MASVSLFGTGGVQGRFHVFKLSWKWNRGRTTREHGVDRVLESMAGRVRLVEDCPLVLAHIALCHTRVSCYRGYTLYADPRGTTYLMDPSCQYLTDSASRLVRVEGITQAKALVDALLAPVG
jgi:hypothetical protein